MTPRRTYDAALQEAERLRGELVEESPGRASREELSRWADDPVGWVREADGEPTDYQREVMESVATSKRTAWKGCHGCGKDRTLGWLAVHGAYSRGMLVLVVSATERQVVGQTMGEVRKAWRAARKAHGIGGQLFQGSVRVDGEDRIVALTGSANVDALTGWHDENGVMVLISEGQGERLEETAYDAAEGNVTTEKGRIVAAGNPVRAEGRFYEIFQKATWNRFTTSIYDTPNVKAGEVVCSWAPAPGWPEEKAREFGKDSSWFVGRGQAEFPDTAEDSLVKQLWLEAAVERHGEDAFREDRENEYAVLAIDVARFGRDSSVLCIRRGRHVVGFETSKGEDTQQVARRAYAAVQAAHDGGRSPVRTVVVDVVGVGAGVADKMGEMLSDVTWMETRRGNRGISRRSPKLLEFNAGAKAKNPERFRDLKAQAYWHLRTRLEEGTISLPDDPGLSEELRHTHTQVTPDGRVAIEAKKKVKARLGGSSPDRADALAMSLLPELKSSGGVTVRWR